MEGLAEAGEGHIESSRNKIMVQVRAEVLDDRLTGKQGMLKVSLTYRTSSGNIHIQTTVALMDGMYDRIKVLEGLYHMALTNGQMPPAPPVGTTAVNSFRLPAWDKFTASRTEDEKDENRVESGAGGVASHSSQTLRAVIAGVQLQDRGEWRECVAHARKAKNSLQSVGGVSPAQLVQSRDSEFRSGIAGVGMAVCENMAGFPHCRDKILRFLMEECGLQPEMLDEQNPDSWKEMSMFDRGSSRTSGSWYRCASVSRDD